ncbi:MAG: hypothetical protein J2P30_19415 [Actinobacteria bacterium]|nr:hypothetical protein [Actinomycetota bacterium]
MLMLYDRTAGQVAPVVPARRGLLGTWTAGPAEGPAQAVHLRAYLVADLIRRLAERHGLVVTAWQSDPGDAAGHLGTDLAALNIHPAQTADDPPGPVDLVITRPGPEPAVGPVVSGAAARWVYTAPVLRADRGAAGTETPATQTETLATQTRTPATGAGTPAPGTGIPAPGTGTPATGTGPVTAVVAGRGLDPLALRLALLQQHYREPAAPGWDTLAAAGQQLRRWREQVAEWARSPSKPMGQQYTADIAAALDGDLDVPAALRWLVKLAADHEVPPGSKFETFAYQDQVLGLDLARDIGR